MLILGANKTRIACHKILPCFFSYFFDSALNGSFPEVGKPEMELPDDDEDAVRAFVQ